MPLPSRLRRAVAGIIAALCCAAGPAAGTAHAATDHTGSVGAGRVGARAGDGYCHTRARIFAGFSTSKPVKGYCAVLDDVDIESFSYAAEYVTCNTGVRTNIWATLTDLRTGVHGQVSSCWVTVYS